MANPTLNSKTRKAVSALLAQAGPGFAPFIFKPDKLKVCWQVGVQDEIALLLEEEDHGQV